MRDETVIIIHAYQNPFELERCLDSIERSQMSDLNILIVDNSYEEKKRTANKEAAEHFSEKLKIIYADQTYLETVTAQLPQEDQEFLSTVHLGERNWSTHHARNAGMLLSRFLYPDMLHSWNLDQDMVIPSDNKLETGADLQLGCAEINGCPDMSRLEWVGFYHLYLGQKYGIDTGRAQQDYAQKLAATMDMDSAEDMLFLYSDFVSSLEDGGKPNIPTFEQREEFYGACYVSRWDNAVLMVPKWYDNDWFFFRQTRKNKDPVSFLPLSVYHSSLKKTVLGKEGLEVEEYGKIVNEVYDILNDKPECSAEDFNKIIKWRVDILDTELSANEKLSALAITPEEKENLSRIKPFIAELKSWCIAINLKDVTDDINAYYNDAAAWKRVITHIEKITQETTDNASRPLSASR